MPVPDEILNLALRLRVDAHPPQVLQDEFAAHRILVDILIFSRTENCGRFRVFRVQIAIDAEHLFCDSIGGFIR
jgi:hypothetical protein